MKKKEETAASKWLADWFLELKTSGLQEHLAKEVSLYDGSDRLVLITKTVKDTSKEILKESRTTTDAIDSNIKKAPSIAPKDESPQRILDFDQTLTVANEGAKQTCGNNGSLEKRDPTPEKKMLKNLQLQIQIKSLNLLLRMMVWKIVLNFKVSVRPG